MVAPNGSSPSSTTTSAPARTPKMTLQSILRGRQRKPLRALFYGPDGVGKTTLATSAPGPIVIPTEEGANQLEVAKFPRAESIEEFDEAVRTLTMEKHEFKTAVIDSLDWLEALVLRKVCEVAGVDSIEDVKGGFGKGYTAAMDIWRRVINDIERMQRERGLHVLLVAHAQVKQFKNPEGDDYDRYSIKMNDKAAALWREWCEGVYFCNFEVIAKKDNKTKRVRGVSTDSRHIFTERTGAYDAKDRYGLPQRIPLSWDDFWAAYEAGQPADPVALDLACREKAKQLGGDIEKSALEYLERNRGNSVALAQLNTRLNAKLGERAEQSAPATPAA